MTSAERLTHALSFDVEDWFHLLEIPAVDDPSSWPELSARSSLVERYTDAILALCDRYRVRATFFVLGWIADRHPRLVRRIHQAGHELGTHSYWHHTVYDLTPESFRDDIARSLRAIRRATGTQEPVRWFRAPSFSITRGTEWAFDVLAEQGIHCDASLFPARRQNGGYRCARGPQLLQTPHGRPIGELPMSTATLAIGPARRTMCYSGGGYFRLLPMSLIRQGMEREAAAGRPTVVYLHPRDFAVDCPRPRMPLHRAFKCFVGLGTTGRKLTHLLERYAWTTCGEVLKAHGCWPGDVAHAAEAAIPERGWRVAPDLPLDSADRPRPPRITPGPPPLAWPAARES